VRATHYAAAITDAESCTFDEDAGASPIPAFPTRRSSDLDTVSYVTADGQTGTYGTFSIGADGAWSYTLDNSNPATNALDVSETSYEQFTLPVTDHQTASNAVVTITVHGTNDPPTIPHAES